MNITNISGLSAVSWCPHENNANLLVTGSLVGTVTLDFAATASLTIYRVENDGEKKVVGAIETQDKFYKLTWGAHAQAGLGLIAGSMLNGTIMVWNPQTIIEEYQEKGEIIRSEETKSIVASFTRHDGGEVQGLSFNNQEAGLLVSGGADSKLNFYDLRDIENPTTMDIINRTPHTQQNVVGVAWNRAYPEIMASCSMQGLCVIWDIGNARHLVTFSSDTQKRAYKCVDWNPKTPTFVALASSNDDSPEIEIWNLQVPNQPVRVLKGHENGILSLMWCPYDENILISGGKDGRTIIWNPNTGEKLGELPKAKNWVFDVQWSYKTSLVSIATYDKEVKIYSILDATIGTTQKSASALEKAPVWLSRPVSAVFGFGGLLVSTQNPQNDATQNEEETSQSYKITVQRVQSESELPKRANALFDALKEERHMEYVEERREENNIWELMAILADEQKNDKLFEMLGFNREKVREKAEEEDLINQAEEQKNRPKTLESQEMHQILKECVITANWEAAVELCFKANAFTEALIFAKRGSEELYENTQKRYLEQQPSPALNMIVSIDQSMATFVDESELNDWKMTLAILCTYAKGDFVPLCERLGNRLHEEGLTYEAAVCFMCADCYGDVLQIWVEEYMNVLHDSEKRVSADEAAFPLLEKFLIYQKIVNQKFSVTGSLKSAFIMLTVDLTTQGHFEDALWLASLVEDDDINMLKHRLYHSVNENKVSKDSKPSTPWGNQTTNFAAAMKTQQNTTTKNTNNKRVEVDPRLNTNSYINTSNQAYTTPTPSGAVANFGISTNLQNPNLYAQQMQRQQSMNQPGQMMNQSMNQSMHQQMRQPVMTQPPNMQQNYSHQNMNQPAPMMKNPVPFSNPMVPGQGVQYNQPNQIVPPVQTSNTASSSVSASPSSSLSQSDIAPRKRRVTAATIDDLDFESLNPNDAQLCETLKKVIVDTFGDGSALSDSHRRRYDYACESLQGIYQQFSDNSLEGGARDLLEKLVDMMATRQLDNFRQVHKELSSKYSQQAKGWGKGLKFLKQAIKL